MEDINVNKEKVAEAEREYAADVTKEFSTYGISVVAGLPQNFEFDPALQGDQALRVYREMIDNDSTVSALMLTIQMLFRRVKWIIDLPEAQRGVEEAEEQRDFIENCLFFDMSQSFDEFMSNVMTMLPYGYSLFEVVYKKRDKENSIYPDGRYGIKKLAFIPQRTRYRWDIKNNGDIVAFGQKGPDDRAIYVIPYNKCLHFKVQSADGNPEGKSILRGAYRAWYYLKRVQDFEAIGVERELNGIPIVSIPDAILKKAQEGDPASQEVVNSYKRIARDLKANNQAGVLIPSDVYKDAEGKPTSNRKVNVELLSNRGSRAMDTDKIINRYQQDIARSIIASFIMLGGQERGSFALAESQQSLFLAALEAWTEIISYEINTKLIPNLIKINGMNEEYIPYIRPGDLNPLSFDELASAIMKLAQAGMRLFPDDVLENAIREKGGLPLLDPNYTGQIPQGYADQQYGTNYQDDNQVPRGKNEKELDNTRNANSSNNDEEEPAQKEVNGE